jgi:hypothetical protein
MRRLVAMLAVLLLSALPGCGLMFGGTHQAVSVQSSPEAVKVTTTPPTGDFTTPTTLNLERKNDYSLTFEKEGYTPAHFQIQHHMRGGILALDIIFTGLLGIIPDAATGAWNGLKPETVNVTLTKTAAIDGPDQIHVGVRVGEKGAAIIEASAPVSVRVERVRSH